MSDYDDKLTKYERRYVYSVPLLFLLGFGVFLFRYILGMDVDFDINGKSGIFINVCGAIITGYALSVECTIIHYMLNMIRQKQGFVKVLFIILFVPALFGGVVFSAIMTIPYYLNCSKKIKRIKMDNSDVLLKWQKISLIVLGIIDVLILIAYFI